MAVRINAKNKTFEYDNGRVIPIPKEFQEELLQTEGSKDFQKEQYEYLKQGISETPGLRQIDVIKEQAKPMLSLVGVAEKYLEDPVFAASRSFKGSKGQEGMGFLERIADNYVGARRARGQLRGELSESDPIASGIGKGAGMAGELGLQFAVNPAVGLSSLALNSTEASPFEGKEFIKELGSHALPLAAVDLAARGLGRVAGMRGEYRAAKEALPAEQAAARAEFAANTAKQARRVENLVQEGKVSQAALGVENFIDGVINTSRHVNSSEGQQVSNILRKTFQSGSEGGLSGKQLGGALEALNDTISTSQGEVKQLLTAYRDQLYSVLPEVVADARVSTKYAGKVQNILEAPLAREIESLGKSYHENRILNEVMQGKSAEKTAQQIVQEVEQTMSESLGNSLNNWEQSLSEALENSPTYQKVRQELADRLALAEQLNATNQMSATVGKGKNLVKVFGDDVSTYRQLEQLLDQIPNRMISRSQKPMQRLASNVAGDAAGFKNTADVALNRMSGDFVEPMISEASGFVDQGARFLEDTDILNALKKLKSRSTETIGAATIGNLVGAPLKTALKAGVTGFGAAKALTSPGMVGQALRGGIRATPIVSQIAQKAQSYPSYRDGILDDPQDRMDLVNDMENDSSLSLEQRAFYQNKVNRGQPL